MRRPLIRRLLLLFRPAGSEGEPLPENAMTWASATLTWDASTMTWS